MVHSGRPLHFRRYLGRHVNWGRGLQNKVGAKQPRVPFTLHFTHCRAGYTVAEIHLATHNEMPRSVIGRWTMENWQCRSGEGGGRGVAATRWVCKVDSDDRIQLACASVTAAVRSLSLPLCGDKSQSVARSPRSGPPEWATCPLCYDWMWMASITGANIDALRVASTWAGR